MNIDLELLSKEISNNNAVLFVGAGFSKNAEPINEDIESYFMSWNEFIVLLAKNIWPSIKNENELMSKCSDYLYIVQLFKDRFGENEFYKMVKKAIPAEEYVPSSLHKELLSLPWCDIITTNMDNLIEKTFEILRFPKCILVEDKDLSINSTLYPKIIKMHGTIERPDSIVFSEEDYRRYEEEHPLIVTKIKQIFAEKTVFFIGFSLTDPNFKKIFLWVNEILKKYQKRAYAFIPDADKNEIEYWRNRNIVIFNGDSEESDYSIKIKTIIKELSERVKLSNLEKFEDFKEYIFEGSKYDEKMKSIEEGIKFYKLNNKERYLLLEETIEYNYNIINKSEKIGAFKKYKRNILDLIIGNMSFYTYVWYNVIEEFGNIKNNRNIYKKFFYIISIVFETYGKMKFRFTYDYDEISMEKIKEIDFYTELFNKVDFKEKELLTFHRIKELYYQERKYEYTVKFIIENNKLITNMFYQDEIKYIELLCHKHLCNYDRIEEFAQKQSFKLENSLNSIRLGYLNYLIGDLKYMKINYKIALNNTEDNYSNSLIALYILKLMNLYMIDNKQDDEYLENKKAQINQKINLSIRGNIFNIEKELINKENKIINNLVRKKNNDIHKFLEQFYDYMYLCEYYGIPDIVISNNEYFKDLFEYFLMNMSLKDYIDSIFNFGVNVENLNFSNKVIEFIDIKAYIFEKLNEKITKCMNFMNKNKPESNYLIISFPLRMLDETLKLIKKVIDIFNAEQIKSLADKAFNVLEFGLPQYNNQVLESSSNIIKETINKISPKDSINIFERYLEVIINSNLDMYIDFGGIYFKWSEDDFKSFNYNLFIKMLNKINVKASVRPEQYFQIAFFINNIRPFIESDRTNMLKGLLEIKEKYSNCYEYLIILDCFCDDKKEIINTVLNFCDNFLNKKRKSIKNNKFCISTKEINDYLILSKFINYIEDKIKEEIFKLSIKEINGTNNSKDSFKLYIIKNIINYIIKYSELNNCLDEIIPILKNYILYLLDENMKDLRRIYENNPKNVDELIDELIKKIRSNDKNEKHLALFQIRKFYNASTKIVEKDKVIIELLKNHIYSSDTDVLKWTISTLAVILKNNKEWATENADSLFKLWYDNFDTIFMDLEDIIVANSYFLNNIYNYCNKENIKLIEEIITKLKGMDSIIINAELTNFI